MSIRSALTRPVIDEEWARPVVWVFALALVVRLIIPTLVPSLIRDSDDLTRRYGPIAESLLDGEGFQLDGAPTAVAPPGYPLFVAASRALFGTAAGALRLPQLVLDALTAVLVLAVGWSVLGRPVGIVSGILAALCPYSVYPVLIATSDTVFLFVHTVALLLVVRLADRPTHGRAILAGVAIGAATLVRAVPLLLPLALALVLVLVNRVPLRRRLAPALLLVAAFASTVTPWTVRNLIHFQYLIPIQRLGGYHLYMGTFDNEWDQFRRQADRINRRAGSMETADLHFVRGTLQRVRERPRDYLRLVGRRLVDMWTRTCSGSYRLPLTVVNGLLLLVAGAGVLAERRRIRALIPLLTVLGYYVALHSVLFALFRYMLPVLPVLLVLAAAAVTGAWRRWLGEVRNIRLISRME